MDYILIQCIKIMLLYNVHAHIYKLCVLIASPVNLFNSYVKPDKECATARCHGEYLQSSIWEAEARGL
jgi:hypothetical protein